MRRRTLLATIPALAALAGCNGRSSEPASAGDGTTTTTAAATTTANPTTSETRSTETTTGTETTETTTTEATTTVHDPDYPRFVELASIDGTDYPGLAFDVRLHSDRIDSDRTATFTATLENTGDTTLEFDMGYRPPFSKVHCEGGGYLLVKPSEDADLDACWEPPRPVGQPQLLSMKELDPGEVLTNSMKLWGDPRTDACLPAGEFRFVSDFEVTSDGEADGRANAFTIRVRTG